MFASIFLIIRSWQSARCMIKKCDKNLNFCVLNINIKLAISPNLQPLGFLILTPTLSWTSSHPSMGLLWLEAEQFPRFMKLLSPHISSYSWWRHRGKIIRRFSISCKVLEYLKMTFLFSQYNNLKIKSGMIWKHILAHNIAKCNQSPLPASHLLDCCIISKYFNISRTSSDFWIIDKTETWLRKYK